MAQAAPKRSEDVAKASSEGFHGILMQPGGAGVGWMTPKPN
jgi:hypothetical protein